MDVSLPNNYNHIMVVERYLWKLQHTVFPWKPKDCRVTTCITQNMHYLFYNTH